MGVSLPPETLLRFFTMIAHIHDGVWNAADPARSLGVSEPTVLRYLYLFAGLFLVRQLEPWHENIGKRQVRAPKVYVRDSGMLHALVGLRTQRELLRRFIDTVVVSRGIDIHVAEIQIALFVY
jgi:predicted AAA+ superfamily ATPase